MLAANAESFLCGTEAVRGVGDYISFWVRGGVRGKTLRARWCTGGGLGWQDTRGRDLDQRHECNCTQAALSCVTCVAVSGSSVNVHKARTLT